MVIVATVTWQSHSKGVDIVSLRYTPAAIIFKVGNRMHQFEYTAGWYYVRRRSSRCDGKFNAGDSNVDAFEQSERIGMDGQSHEAV